MFASVLFPTDFSSHATEELDCLTSFPQVRAIHLVHVVKPFPIRSVEKLIHDRSGEYLAAAQEYLARLNPGVAVTLEVARGRDIAGTILRTAADRESGLIIISGFAAGYRAGILLGKVPETILCRTGQTDVLVMPNRLIDNLARREARTRFCRNIFSTILCPTEFSETSKRAIACIGSIPGVREILLLHVPDEGEGAVQDPEARLEAMKASLAAGGAKVRVMVRDGEPSRTIARVAEEEDVSLVWMSMETQGCLRAFLAGSTIEETLARVERPLMVVRSVA